MEQAYVTGKGGFIGRKVVEYLKAKGAEIAQTMTRGCTVVHLAAYGNHHFQTETDKIIQANITDLKSLIDEALFLGIEKFYNISTSSVTLPVQTLYSASKLLGEGLINDLKDKRFVNVRPYSIYGEGEAAHRFIPTVIRHLKSGETMQLDPQAMHDWLHVDDFVKELFTGHYDFWGGVKSIGSGEQVSNMGIVEILEEISGKKLNYTLAMLRNYDTLKWVCPDYSRSRKSLRVGLKQTYDYYNALP